MKKQAKYKSKRNEQLFVKEGAAPLLTFKPLINNIYNMDCIEGLKQLPDGSIDLVITAPPFAIEFKAKRSNYNRTQYFGKKWKHLVRDAQQFLKEKGLIYLRGEKWHLMM